MKTNMSLLMVALLTVSGSLLAQPATRFHNNAPSFKTPALSPEQRAFAQTERLVKALDLSDKQALKVLKIHRSYAGKPFDEKLTKDIASVLKGYQKEKYTNLIAQRSNRRDNPRHLNGRGFNRNNAKAFSDARQGFSRQGLQQGKGLGKQTKQRKDKGLQIQGQQRMGMGKRG
jgi:hypothetical protein